MIFGILGLGVIGTLVKPTQTNTKKPVLDKETKDRREFTPSPSEVDLEKSHYQGGQLSEATQTLAIPTESRSWRSADGRALVGKVTEINLGADTITMERADGQVFKAFPISKLHPEDAAILRSAK